MIKKRFIEITSLMTVRDNQTGKEYNCEMGIDTDLLELLNAQHEEIEKLKKEKEQLIQSIQDGAKIAADGIIKSMDKNFTLDTKYYRKRY